MSETRRMDPADVPDDLIETVSARPEVGLVVWPHELRTILAVVLPEHEKQVRAKVAEEILADVEPYFAARIGAEMWEAAYRAARIARGES